MIREINEEIRNSLQTISSPHEKKAMPPHQNIKIGIKATKLIKTESQVYSKTNSRNLVVFMVQYADKYSSTA